MSKFFKGSRESVLLPVTAHCMADGGSDAKVNFKVRYRRPAHTEVKELKELAANGLTDDELAKRLVITWQDVVDGNDQPIEYSAEALAEALETHGYREAIVRGACVVVFGKKETEALEAVRLKNLQKSAAPG